MAKIWIVKNQSVGGYLSSLGFGCGPNTVKAWSPATTKIYAGYYIQYYTWYVYIILYLYDIVFNIVSYNITMMGLCFNQQNKNKNQ